MDTVVFVDPKAIEFFSNTMVLAKINAEVDTVTAKKYHVSGYPTTVLVNKKGEEVDRIIGYAPTEEFLQMLIDYSNGIGTLGDLLAKAKTTTDLSFYEKIKEFFANLMSSDEGNDTVDDPLSTKRSLYMEIADKYKYRGGSEEAMAWFGKVIDSGKPLDSLSGESRISLADLHRRAKEYDKSLEVFNSISNDFKTGIFAETADIYIAIVNKSKGDTTAAIAAFEKFTTKWPESEDVEYAQKQIKKLKNSKEEEKSN